MSSNGIVDLTSSSNDSDLVSKTYVNSNYLDNNNFKKTHKSFRRRIKRNFRKIIFYRSHN